MALFITMMLAVLSLFLILLLLPKSRRGSRLRLPPGPHGLPLIGNLHQLDTNDLPSCLWQLSKQYGPLMFLRLGFMPVIVVSSAEMAKEILKTNDHVFCSRPTLLGQKKISYNNRDIAFSPYNDYWREMRKVSTLHLFSAKKVASFRPVREEEVSRMIDTITRLSSSSLGGKCVINLSETLMTLTSNIICRVGFGKKFEDEGLDMKGFCDLFAECQAVLLEFYFADYFPILSWVDKLNGKIGRLEKTFKAMDEFYQDLIDDHVKHGRKPNINEEDVIDILLRLKDEALFPMDLTFDHIKAILMNLLVAATETSAAAVAWAMTLLIKNPETLNKAQAEVRKVIGEKGKVEEGDLPKLTYLKAVIKETMRLYPVVPLLLPRESMDGCVINGHEIPAKTLVYVNTLALGRDPDTWEEPDKFLPERFLQDDHTNDVNVDYRLGKDFEMIPFGAGRRVCPGISMGSVNMELALSSLLYKFHWELEVGVNEEDVDTVAKPGISMQKKNDLCLVASVLIH